MGPLTADVPAALSVRIPPARSAELGPLGRLAAWVGGRAAHGDRLRVVATVGRHRRLLRRWLPFATALLRGTELSSADVELVILRTAWNCASWYEWVEHAPRARRAGLARHGAARVAEGPGAPGWTDHQRLLLTAVDELHEHRVISDTTWRLLIRTYDDRRLLELCFLVGHYEMLAMALNSLGVEPEPSALDRVDRLDADGVATTGRLQRALAARRRPGP